MFAFRETAGLGPGHPRVEVAFTDATLDLQAGADKRDDFSRALASLQAACGVSFARLHQVHGDEVVEVAGPWPAGPREPGEIPVGDALVTARRGVGLMVRVADCVPVLLADPGAGVIGAAHAGRKGVALNVVARTVEQMRALGAADVRAWIGPHVCGRCYEVPAAMREEVAAAVPAAHAETSWGTPSLDLGAGVAAQLDGLGVAVTRVPGCTLEEDRFHSHRRDGVKAGRAAGLVWLP